jgi:hypothetical protein
MDQVKFKNVMANCLSVFVRVIVNIIFLPVNLALFPLALYINFLELGRIEYYSKREDWPEEYLLIEYSGLVNLWWCF